MLQWKCFFSKRKRYRRRAIISRGLSISYPGFHCGLYCRAVYIIERLIMQSGYYFTILFHLTFIRTPFKKSRNSVYVSFLLYSHTYIFFVFFCRKVKKGENKELFLNLRFILQNGLYYKKLFWTSKSVVYNPEWFQMKSVL